MRLLINLLIALLVSTSVLAETTPLSDTEARKILQQAEGVSYLVLPPEARIWVRRPFDPDTSQDWKKRIVGSGYVNFMSNLFKLGLITYDNVEQPGKQSVNIPYDVVHNVKGIQLTEKTDAHGRPWLILGKRQFGRIVKNSPWKVQARSSDEHRLVLGFFEYTANPLGKEWAALFGKPPSKDWKFRALLRADPFKQQFVFVGWDIARADEEFQTNNVGY